MSYAASRVDMLGYDPCRYGLSKLVFRGPKKDPADAYVAMIGGTETYGRFVATPFSDLVERALDMPVINLGCQNAGLDAFLYDSDVMALAKRARMTVVQVMGAQYMSNRYYRVHPRRNDRFLGPSETLKTIFREVDFTDFSFVRHMLSTLQMVSPERFGLIRSEMQQAWVARMKLLLGTIDGPVILLWLKDAVPVGLGAEPLFIGADMVQDVADTAQAVVEVSVARAGENQEGMVVGPTEGAIAAEMLGVSAHQAIASALQPVLKDHL